ncbi:dTMP kinase [Pseudosporangium ferrugineum]|uniref:Thymidylate kinase n=1 Tax=Pseudosporangium ferrugineum TaxID=439699 RepID=A0A2T0RLI0_9ACTN|nr:dTMP kinase [Pseudosporangium ferrugineum]PRY21982.1 dTMP kinase [Pseudosporangium ferrugineum]
MAFGFGMFITLDGQSGAGKSTTARLVCDQLRERGHEPLLTCTPSSTGIGELARRGTFDFRGNELALLVAADRYHHERTVIRPAVADGAIVVCDRYVASSMVFDLADGVRSELRRAVYSQLPAADLTIILCGEPALCAQRAARRGHYSRFHSADVAANERERNAFLTAADDLRRQGRRVLTYDVGSHPAEAVARRLADVILDRATDAA